MKSWPELMFTLATINSSSSIASVEHLMPLDQISSDAPYTAHFGDTSKAERFHALETRTGIMARLAHLGYRDDLSAELTDRGIKPPAL